MTQRDVGLTLSTAGVTEDCRGRCRNSDSNIFSGRYSGMSLGQNVFPRTLRLAQSFARHSC